MEENSGYCVLDEAEDFYRKYVVTSDVNTRTAVLLAAVTYATPSLVTLPRALWTSEEQGMEKTGKTTAMNVCAAISASPEEADGSYAALRSALKAVGNTPEAALHTWTFDAIDNVLGEDGTNSGNPTLIKLLEKGYKLGAHDSVSEKGTKKKIPLFYVVLMTGKGVSLRRDIRSRTIVMRMTPSKPGRYFSVREGEPEARALGRALGRKVSEHLEEIKEFRGLGLHPKLLERRLEVWEPLFAVASALGGQRWVNYCRDAFEALALSTSGLDLSPKQKTLHDASEALALIPRQVIPNGANVGKVFAGGLALAEEVKRMDGWEEKSALGVAQAIAEHMRPVTPRQVRFGKGVVSGYLAEDIISAWEAVRPEEMDDAVPAEEVNPFAVDLDLAV